MKRRFRLHLPAVLLLALGLPIPRASAQTATNYKQTNLSSDGAVSAPNTDRHLINPWGIAFIPGSPFWIADNNSGFSTLYDRQGVLQSAPIVVIPPPAGQTGTATPTGVVVNNTGGFAVNGSPSFFIFSTEDGTISAWTSGNSAVLEVNNPNFNSGTDPVYKSLAMITNGTGAFLLAPNFRSGKIDVFDSTFRPATLAGNFTDPTLPSGFAPFGVHVLANNQVYVTYAKQDPAMHDPVDGPGNGFVSLFDVNGNFVRRVISQGQLNSPWAVVTASANFGQFSNDLLVGNFGDGTINAFDPATGNFLGTLKDSSGNAIVNGSLWDLVFDPSGQTGAPDTLYFTAGLADEADGVFGAITVDTGSVATADFSISANSRSLTVVRGSSASTDITVTPSNGFSGTVSFTCSGLPGGATCVFTPPSVTPSGGPVTTQLSISTASTGQYATVRRMGLIVPVSHPWIALGAGLAALALLFLLFLASTSRLHEPQFRVPAWVALLLVAGLLSATAACSSSGSSMGTPTGTFTVMVNAVSGATMQSTSINVTVR